MIANLITILKRTGGTIIPPMLDLIWSIVETNWEVEDENWEG
tara:strand:+ start:2719 stop:2844 length:126 start_codon:yes stop_codon:yes gene_type:complete